MAISFNTGTTVSNGGTLAASQAITIPAGVLNHDVLLIVFCAFRGPGGGEVMQASSTGTAPTLISSLETALFNSAQVTAGLFYVVASATDAGKVITGSLVSSDTANWAAAIASYTGASTSAPIDVSGNTSATGNNSSLTCPSETTGVANDWDIQLFGAALAGAAYGGGAGFTQRESIVDGSSGAGAVIYDSNASVGPAGTGIGGANFTNAGNNSWWVGWTVGLAPAAVAAVSGTVQPAATITAARRRLSRAVVRFTPVTTVNTGHGPAGTVQPASARAAPRRVPARAVVRFTPVTTTNGPAKPKPPHGTPASDEARGYKRWLLWGP